MYLSRHKKKIPGNIKHEREKETVRDLLTLRVCCYIGNGNGKMFGGFYPNPKLDNKYVKQQEAVLLTDKTTSEEMLKTILVVC